MKWHRFCSSCKHKYDFDPLTDECPYEENPAECDWKLVKDIKAGKGLPKLMTREEHAEAHGFRNDAKPRRRNKRPEVMPQPTPYYTHGDRYPDSIRISFEDGHTEIYDRRISQPRPETYINYPKRRTKA